MSNSTSSQCHIRFITKCAPVVAATIAGLFVASKLIGCASAARKKSAEKARRAKQEKGVVYLYAFPAHPTLGQMSAPCAKLETFLKLNKIKYETIEGMDTSVSPTGRLPAIEIDGVMVADSTFAIKYLIEKFGLTEKEETSLTAAQHAKGIALRRMTEDSIRLSLYRFTMVDNADFMFNRIRSQLPKKFPSVVIKFLLNRAFRPRIINMLNLHGHGDLTDAQYHEEFLADVKALESMLSETKFAVGDVPTQYDASVVAWVRLILASDLPIEKCAALKYAANNTVLIGYKAAVEAAITAAAETK